MTMAYRARRQERAQLRPQYIANRRCSRRMRPRSITAVTRISGTGIVPKHANGRFSDVTSFSETSMPLGKKFFTGRSELTRVQRRVAADTEFAPASRMHALRHPTNAHEAGARRVPDGGPREAVPSNRAPRRFILATGFELASRAATRCVIFADLAFTNFPVAVLSWLMTQFFVGCAAYAEAMYPSAGYVSGNDASHRYGPADNERAEADHVSPSPQLAPDLKELSGFAIEAGARRSPARPIQTGPVTTGSGENGNIVWLNVTRKTPSRRFVSTALLVTTWLSKRRRSAPHRPVTVELRNYDRRTPRGAATPRYGTE
jgi:hypothetical protein